MTTETGSQVGTDNGNRGHNSEYDARATGRLTALSREDTRTATVESIRWWVAYVLAGAYVVAGVLAVIFTDRIVEWWIGTVPETNIHIALGLFFVAVSGAVLALSITWFRRRVGLTQHQVQERDSHIGRIIDTMANGVALFDLDGTIVDCNPALAQMLGRKRQQLIGKSLAPIREPGDERVTPASMILEYARRDGQWSGELERLHSDDYTVPVHLTLAPLYDDDGQLVGYVGDYLDLRDVRTAEQHLDGLGAVIERLATETDLEAVGNNAVAAAIELTDTDLGGAVVLDDEVGQLQHRWLQGFDDDISTPLPADDPQLAARVIEDAQPLIIEALDTSAHTIKLYHDADAVGLVAVPIEVGGLVRGALIVASRRPLSEFGDRELPLLEAIARQIGVALHRHELLEDARRSEARFRNVVNSVPDILYTAEMPGFKTRFISPSVQQLLGIEPDEFIANPTLWRDHIHEDDLERVDQIIASVRDHDDEYAVEYRAFNHDRSRCFWVEDRGRMHRDDQGKSTRVTGVISNITARKEAEDRLAFLAFNDRLTGLPNRVGLLNEMSELFDETGPPPSVLLYCDLDRFHLVNDIHGHDCGNDLLVETARRIEQMIPSDAILARMGADEFVAFIPIAPEHLAAAEAGGESCQNLLEQRARDYVLQIMAAFRKPFSIRDQPSYLSTTVGIGLSSDDVDSPRGLLKNAHRALAHAKETGPANFEFYAGQLADRQQRRLSLQSKIHGGLDNDEFQLYYQPIVDLQTGRIVGGEALLRWTTSCGESISPGEFIPVAEQSGLIIPLGDWVLHQACRDLKQWLNEGFDLKMSLNLSPRQFFHLDIVDRLHSAVRSADVPPGRLELELTESDMLVDPEEIAQVLTRLRDVGFSIAIDDFGTGYSSLQRLDQLPVQTLKIDRSFVSELTVDSDDASIVDTILTLSDNFEMTPLAEGIETREQWQLLHQMGCRFGQGYFFSRPIPADQFHQLVTAPPSWEKRTATVG